MTTIILAFLLMQLMIPFQVSAEEPVTKKRTSVIHLNNGDHVNGILATSSSPDTIGWQAPFAVSPFQFALSGVNSINYSLPETLPQPQGLYLFELAQGDVLYGSINSLDDDTATLDIPDVGRVTLAKTAISSIRKRQGGSEVLFAGPNGLQGWTHAPEGAWQEDAATIWTDRDDAVLSRDFSLPNQSHIEFEVSWSSKPYFELAIGVNETNKSFSKAYHFDVWENKFVVQRQTENEADVEILQKLGPGPGRIHLHAFLDQMNGKMLVYSANGDKLADLTVRSTKPQILGGLQLKNRRGDIHLERLQIHQWNEDLPTTIGSANEPSLSKSDGTVIPGALKSYQPDQRQFVMIENGQERTLPEGEVQSIKLEPKAITTPASLRAVYWSGMKIRGDITGLEGDTIWLKSPEMKEPIQISMNSLHSLRILENKSESRPLPQRAGRLEAEGTIVQGCLVDGTHPDGSSCLIWQPINSSTSSPLTNDLAAKIVYVEPPKPLSTVRKADPTGGLPSRIDRKLRTGQPSTGLGKESILHLRTGDIIPCAEVTIDEKGLSFQSKVSESSFVPHDKIHALELLPEVKQIELDQKKIERLLTLPRMQRRNPPTHLIRSIEGDYLRGRLVSMDDAQLQVELRLEGKIIRRDRVARIIWLPPEPSSGSDPKTPQSNLPALDNLVQAVHHNGSSTSGLGATSKRMTFKPESVEGTILSGKSELFGVCRIDLMQVDELYIGNAISKVAAELPFSAWKLRSAAEPLGQNDEGGSDAERDGLESPLVGKAAPEIVLKDLDGKAVTLSELKGKVVVLDFWASWCGPCLQVMPQINRVAEEFREQGVELLAINQQETAEQVTAALNRLKLTQTVLLDRDGRISEKYVASTIPQTVIVDRDGKIARLFIGGGARFDELLRKALTSVLAEPPAANDTPAQ